MNDPTRRSVRPATRSAQRVYVSIGSNIRPAHNLRLACRELNEAFGPLTLSSVYQNPAVGFEGDDFLNMVVGFSSSETPATLHAFMEHLHVLAQRKRLANPFSPRTLDVDVLLYGDLVDPALKLPHDDIEKYAFVLGPLAEIAPRLRHPLTGLTIREMWAAFDKRGCPMHKIDIGIERTLYQPMLRPPSTAII